MKSKANIKGHPIHPVLIPFPIAFFTGALFLDLLMVFTGEQSFAQAGLYVQIGGLISSLLAAVPGLIDYYFTVPAGSSGKKRATQHVLINSTVVLIFTFSLLLKLNSDIVLGIIAAMEGIAVLLLSLGGWLGGTLVIRNQIGVDHRYAGAGKWQEKRIQLKDDNIDLSNYSNLKTDQMMLLHVDGKRFAVGKTESGLMAFDDRCTHRGGSLADGVLICGTVQCPWHGSQFNVMTGTVKAGPAKENIKTWNVMNLTEPEQEHTIGFKAEKDEKNTQRPLADHRGS